MKLGHVVVDQWVQGRRRLRIRADVPARSVHMGKSLWGNLSQQWNSLINDYVISGNPSCMIPKSIIYFAVPHPLLDVQDSTRTFSFCIDH